MQSDKSVLTALTMAALAVVLCFTVVSADVDAAEQHFDEDRGQIWGEGAGFIFDGADAEKVTWDFGDGTPAVEGWEVVHKYENKGVYYVTQTATNSYNGGSETVTVYKIEIMGYPTVIFDTHGGSAIPVVQMEEADGLVTAPESPVKDGFVFGGWFFDAECTQPYDWNHPISFPTTIHAKWNAAQVVVHKVTFDVGGGSTPVVPMEVEDGKQFTLPAYNGTIDGKEFKGWRLGSTTYQAGNAIMVTEDLVFTAVWQDKPVTPGPVDPEEKPGPEDPEKPGPVDPEEKPGPEDPDKPGPEDPEEKPGPENPGDDGKDDKEDDGHDEMIKIVAFAGLTITGVFIAFVIVRRVI